MNKAKLVELIRSRKSFLCVGLDTDPSKLPAGVSALEFNKVIIDTTREFAVAYKPNLAFYEAMGRQGWDILEETVAYIGNEHFTIADAKRGDIGNTSSYYAKAFFETYGFDSITVAPYMGKDSVSPFLQFQDKWAIVLALTSNEGSKDFQTQKIGEEYLFEKVLRDVASWGTDENTMFVVGATKAESLAQIRQSRSQRASRAVAPRPDARRLRRRRHARNVQDRCLLQAGQVTHDRARFAVPDERDRR